MDHQFHKEERVSRKIADYALIGDCETGALVSKDGCIDWLCWPRFDSEACFAALLGTRDNGCWQIAPTSSAFTSSRRYRGDTLILETTFEAAEGEVTIIEFMPLRTDRDTSDLTRLVVGKRGCVRMRSEMRIRFDYGRIVPWVQHIPGTTQKRVVAGPHSLLIDAPVEAEGSAEAIISEFEVKEGQVFPFRLAYGASHLPPPQLTDAQHSLKVTEQFWRDWSQNCNFEGEWREAVVRSLITTKAMTYRPTGGIVAALTTSLPEKIGGARNWDYRCCWLRDATFALLSLINAGYREEAETWSNWLLRSVAGAAAQLQPIYGISGEHRSDEITLDWLDGFEGSRPVRVGNAAYKQLQIDIFGSVIDTLYFARKSGLSLHEAAGGLQTELVHYLEDVWTEKDAGLWEVRGERQHFVHSKLMAWVAFDRAIRSVETSRLDGPLERWRRIREDIRKDILSRGFDEAKGTFVQCYGSQALDASLLLMPVVGFLPASDPRVRATVDAIEAELMRDGLVIRYDTDTGIDGLPDDEGAFLACSFWLADNMILQGRKKEARRLFERLLSLRNDVGLLAEQYDWRRGELVGNYPQAFSHFSLIDTAYNFAGARGTAREGTDG